MKKILCSALIIFSVMMLLPLTAMKTTPTVKNVFAPSGDIPDANEAVADSFIICDTTTSETTEVKADDYIFGVVASEMPALYETEALKAQAVAAYTYACYRRAENTDKSYDITTDHTTDQSYTTEEKARERWGEKADEYVTKIKDAVSAVSGYMITYENKPILSVYHAISSGKTESCKNIWGTDLPYLVPVNSPGDKLSADYISTLKITPEELAKKVSGELDLSGDPASYFGTVTRTDSGTVEEITLCNKTLRGARIRSLLDLRSSNYDISYADGIFTFTVYGYGHGVGMSQYGANYMAKQGSDFKEILTCYYTGCEVTDVD